MTDSGVHVTIINNTDKPLQYDAEGTFAAGGDWVNVPPTISPHTTSARFLLQDHAGPNGSQGILSYFVGGDTTVSLRTYQTCPCGDSDNIIKIASYPLPLALYDVTFRARSGDGPWTSNAVQPSGHSIEVEYTLSYQKRHYSFLLNGIRSTSSHPVRNSRGDLIVGPHQLWTQDAPDMYRDSRFGSFQPNIFQHDFSMPLTRSGHLSVTVTPFDVELGNAEVILYGTINGTDTVILQTSYFPLPASRTPVTISALVVHPQIIDRPFVWNVDVQWRMRLRHSSQRVQAVGSSITRLELYWVARPIHRAFQGGFPVGFLRDVLGRWTPRTLIPYIDKVSENQMEIARFGFYADMTRYVFGGFHKIYDTVTGASACNMTLRGGTFLEAYYRAQDGSKLPGTLARDINCMDQAAMLELSCSLIGGSISWLWQEPFGYIKPTHLVGIVDASGRPMLVNNPFFRKQPQYAFVEQNDLRRTQFSRHVYVGHPRPFHPANGSIYDACGGPHLGEPAPAYITSSIDTTTTLYQANKTNPGHIGNIQMGDGVTGIDGRFPAGRPPAFAHSADVLDRLLASGAPRASTARTIVHKGWAHVPEWVAGVLGERWTVCFSSVVAGEERAQAFFHLSNGAESGADHVRVSVSVHTKADTDGALDRAGSALAARESATAVIASTDRDPEGLWEAGDWTDHGDWSLQYGPDVGGGRVVVCAANTVVDISGFPSTAALSGIARSLLDRVVRHTAYLEMPVLREGQARAISEGARVEMVAVAPEAEAAMQATSVRVEGAGTSFSLSFEVDGYVAAAGATSSSPALLFDRHVVEELVPLGGQGSDPGAPMSTVIFTFYAREVGHQTVHVHVADSETMLTTTRVVEVEVV